MAKNTTADIKIQFFEDAPKSLSLILPLFFLLSLTYLIWRFSFTVNWFIWFAVPLFILEIYNFLNTFFFMITTRKIWYPIWMPPLAHGTVDIFVPTYNEPEEIVEMTAVGALAVRGVNKVFILDDGNRESIKKLAKKLGVAYFARGDNTHAKAGNLNFGLNYSAADFVLNVDCDHVPQPQFIERTLGYFADPKLAFIQTPQVFYNKDSFQHKETRERLLWNEQTMFYESVQPGKNRYNAAFFCGSGALIRREALDSVGGYATGTATEDIHTSIRIHAKGWKSLFVHENLAFGLAAEDLKEYHKQRVRWGAGSLGLLFRSPDSPLWARGLTLMQRLCYINSAMAYMEGTLKLFYFAIPIFVIFTQKNLIDINLFAYFATYLPFLFLSYLLTYYYSRKTYHFPNTELFNIINIFSHIVALKGIVKIQKKFGVSIKVKSVKQNAIIQPGLLLLAGVMIFADFYGGYLVMGGEYGISNYLLIGIFWNSFNLLFVLYALYYLYVFNRVKREEHKFGLNSVIAALEDGDKGVVMRISLSGAVLEVEKEIKEGIVNLFVELRGKQVRLSGVVTQNLKIGRKWVVRVSFGEHPQEVRNALTIFLFHTVVPQLFAKDFKKLEAGFHVAPGIRAEYV